MTDFVQLALGNLLAPMTLFFVLGVFAGLARSALEIPEAIGKALAIYLMLSIGFKGGAAMAAGTAGTLMLLTMAAGVILSFGAPLIGFLLLRATTAVDATTAAAVAAHYGSVSIVTFVTATGFLGLQNISYDNAMVAVVALMETPAIVSGLLLAALAGGAAQGARRKPAMAPLIREILLNGSVVVLVGAFVIGWITGDKGLGMVRPFIVEPFTGVLCLFLLDLGLIAARQLGGARVLTPSLLAFGLYMPLIGAALGLAVARAIGLPLGDAVLLATLAASASYIAVPAAMRIALPKANAAVYLTLSLAVTFPFNVLIGIPLYFSVGRWLGME